MKTGCGSIALLGCAAAWWTAPPALGASAWVHSAARTSLPDTRVVRDRLHAGRNEDGGDYSFLNAVGAVWPEDIGKSAARYMASSGFLIDRCHVLTNLHAVYIDDVVLDAPADKQVSFAVGQTDGGTARGALLGLKFLLSGAVVAHGDATIVDRRVYFPENDWALIRLTANVHDSITPMSIAAIDTVQALQHRRLSIAGFPADRRAERGDRLHLKDLWASDGEIVQVEWASTRGALAETTIQATRGNSGGPLYGDFNGQHIVIGMHQGIRGNGIDVSAQAPNVEVLFTAAVLTDIRAAQARTACS